MERKYPKPNKLKGNDITMRKIVSLSFDEARAEGENKEKFATVKRMLKHSKSSLADTTELTLANVKQIQAEMQANCVEFNSAI